MLCYCTCIVVTHHWRLIIHLSFLIQNLLISLNFFMFYEKYSLMSQFNSGPCHMWRCNYKCSVNIGNTVWYHLSCSTVIPHHVTVWYHLSCTTVCHHLSCDTDTDTMLCTTVSHHLSCNSESISCDMVWYHVIGHFDTICHITYCGTFCHVTQCNTIPVKVSCSVTWLLLHCNKFPVSINIKYKSILTYI